MWHSQKHYSDVIMSAIASQIVSLTIVYLTIYSDTDQRKHQSSASLAFVRRIHRWPMNSPHKEPVTRKMFHFDDVIMRKQLPFFSICGIRIIATDRANTTAATDALVPGFAGPSADMVLAGFYKSFWRMLLFNIDLKTVQSRVLCGMK